MELREILRHLRRGQSDRAAAEALGIDRKTVAQYRGWAAEQGLLEEAPPSLSELQQLVEETLSSALPPQNRSSVVPYQQVVVRLRQAGVETAAIHQRLKVRGYTGSHSSVYRFVRNLEPRTPDVTVRVETPQRFELERRALRPLPDTPYDMAVWKEVKLHRDCHLVFDQAYYSAPFRLAGQKLWARGGSREVQIFTQDYQLVTPPIRVRNGLADDRPTPIIGHLTMCQDSS